MCAFSGLPTHIKIILMSHKMYESKLSPAALKMKRQDQPFICGHSSWSGSAVRIGSEPENSFTCFSEPTDTTTVKIRWCNQTKHIEKIQIVLDVWVWLQVWMMAASSSTWGRPVSRSQSVHLCPLSGSFLTGVSKSVLTVTDLAAPAITFLWWPQRETGKSMYKHWTSSRAVTRR